MQKIAFSTKLFLIGCAAAGLFTVMALTQWSGAQPVWVNAILTGAGIVIGFVSFVTLRSGIRACRHAGMELTGSWQQLATASGQVASSSHSLAHGASAQAATLEATSASTTEITAIARKSTENTQAVAGLTLEAARLVTNANENLQEMVQSMKEINDSSEKISKIIRVIDEIAFQTNILALNAAVEAARAGEAGMGFAVVADEVRNLAQRSAQAARDTASLIEESIAKSSAGSRKLDQVAQSIHQITASTTQVKTLMDEIAAGTQEQSRGIEQIADAVLQMEKSTQQGSVQAEECASAGAELTDKTKSLRSAVERIHQLMCGTAEPPLEYVVVPRAASSGPAKPASVLPKKGIDRTSFPLEQDGEEF